MKTDLNEQKSNDKKPVDNSLNLNQALGFAWEMGYTMAIPLVLLALGGRFLDHYLNSSPLFLLISILVSVIISSIALGIKATQIINRVDKENIINPVNPKKSS